MPLGNDRGQIGVSDGHGLPCYTLNLEYHAPYELRGRDSAHPLCTLILGNGRVRHWLARIIDSTTPAPVDICMPAVLAGLSLGPDAVKTARTACSVQDYVCVPYKRQCVAAMANAYTW